MVACCTILLLHGVRHGVLNSGLAYSDLMKKRHLEIFCESRRRFCMNRNVCRLRANWKSNLFVTTSLVDWIGFPARCDQQASTDAIVRLPDGLQACQNLVFVHVPKAGGSTIASAIYGSESLHYT